MNKLLKVKKQFTLQQNAFKTMLLTQEGIGLLAAQDALNAVIDVIRGTVNKAIGFALL